MNICVLLNPNHEFSWSFLKWSDCFWQKIQCKNSWKFLSKLVFGDVSREYVSCKFEVSGNYNVAFFRNILATLCRAFRSRSSCDNEKCPSLWIRRKWLKFLSLNKTIVHLAYYNLIQTIFWLWSFKQKKLAKLFGFGFGCHTEKYRIKFSPWQKAEFEMRTRRVSLTKPCIF